MSFIQKSGEDKVRDVEGRLRLVRKYVMLEEVLEVAGLIGVENWTPATYEGRATSVSTHQNNFLGILGGVSRDFSVSLRREDCAFGLKAEFMDCVVFSNSYSHGSDRDQYNDVLVFYEKLFSEIKKYEDIMRESITRHNKAVDGFKKIVSRVRARE